MTIRDIVRQWLTENGFDGLWCEDCGCRTDDLMPCESPEVRAGGCQPGYVGRCDDEDYCEACAAGREHVGPKREEQ